METGKGPALTVSVVLVAAGGGQRFGSRRPKQFLPLAGKPLLYWPLLVFEKTPVVREVILVTAPSSIAWVRAFVRREGLRKVSSVVPGGAERADSVRAGVGAASRDADVVLIHDAARPLVTPEIVVRVAEAARRSGAALAAWPVPDTIKSAKRKAGAAFVRKTVPRARLWLAQTPQGFRRDVAGKIFRRKPPKGITDDVQRAERAGIPVELVPASPENFKVTLPEDFALCGKILRRK